MNRILANATSVVLVLCALVVTGLVARRELGLGSAADAAPREPRLISGWEPLSQGPGSLLGPAEAPTRLVVFSDFQCPFCAQAAPNLQALVARNPGKVSVVFRHLPLESIHPHAFAAAMASACANEQGRFSQYHDELFREQEKIGTKAWDAFAAQAKVPDLPAFRRCVQEERFRPDVQKDLDAAKRLGLGSTPSTIVNGWVVEGAVSVFELEKLLENTTGTGTGAVASN